MSNIPADLRFTSHDEWLRVDGDVVTVGITDFAQDQLGELVHVEFPDVGDAFKPGDAVCEVESVKAVAEIFTPIAGEVIEVNEALEDEAETINSDPYGEGWLFKMRVTDAGGLETCLDAEAYKAKLEG